MMTEKTNVLVTTQIGELVAAAFDVAAGYSDDPDQVSRMASSTVLHMLQNAQVSCPTSHPPADDRVSR